MRKKNYTLIEILSVVIIIGILALIIIQVSGHVSDRNRRIRTEAIIKQLQLALEDCKAKYGYYKVRNANEFSADARLRYDLIMDGVASPRASFPLNPSSPTGAQKYRKDFLKTCDLTKLPTKEINGVHYIVDAWDEPIQYFTDANGTRYTLYSYGKYKVEYTNTSDKYGLSTAEQSVIFGSQADSEENGTVIRAE